MKKIITIIIGLFLTLSFVHIIIQDESIVGYASAESTWTETDWSNTGSYTNASGTETKSEPGVVKLEYGPDLYIVDNINHRLVKTKMDGTGWTSFGTYGTGTGQFYYPEGISLNQSSEYLYVTDWGNDHIVKTKMDGTGWTSYGSAGSGAGNFESPSQLVYDTNSGFVYLADTFNHRIVKTKMDGTGWTTYGSFGSGVGQFHYPIGLDFDDNTGDIYVVDNNNHRIVKTKINGSGWTTYGTFGTGGGQFNYPYGIDYDSNTGYVYVTDKSSHRIVKTKMDGTGWTTYGTYGVGTGQFWTPKGIKYDSNSGNLYITNIDHRIVRTKMDGSNWLAFGTIGNGIYQFDEPRGIALGNKSYFSGGVLCSIPYDCGTNSNFYNISWDADIPSETSIKFQLKTSTTSLGLALVDYVGPDGSSSTYYTTSGTNIWSGHDNEQWIQYKIYLNTTNLSKTPKLKEVKIMFNCFPDQPVLTSPTNDEFINDNTPTFSWTYNDLDSPTQNGFQWQVDDEFSFSSINYGSGDVTSPFSSYNHTTTIDDGIWYWRVKAKDNDNDWSEYSDNWIVKIDTTVNAPASLESNPDTWTPINSFDINWTNPEDLSGIIGAYYQIGIAPTSNTEGNYISGTGINLINDIKASGDGEHTVYVWVKDLADNINYHNHSATKIFLDTSAPAPPLDLTATPNSWSSQNLFNVSWINPIDLSGINGVYYKFDSAPTSNEDGTFISGIDINFMDNFVVAGDGNHTLYVWLKDYVNNVNYLNHSSINLYLDTKPPNSPTDLLINPDTWTATNSFIIDWTNPIDLSGIKNGAYYHIDNSPPSSQVDGVWRPDKPFTITNAPEGENDIYIWLEDIVGNTKYQNYIKGTLRLDQTSPDSLSISINDGATQTNTVDVTLTLNAVDNLSGLYQMAFSTEESSWSNWEDYTETKSYSLSSGDGTKTIYFKVKDLAGNEADPISASIILNTTSGGTEIDTDKDGYPDNNDAFPTDPTEWLDTDGDGYGDNSDAFIDDSSEWLDTDDDGTGNNADPDDDNDGVSDIDEGTIGTDSLLADTDGDGYNDEIDYYPLDPGHYKKIEDSEESKDGDEDNTMLYAGIGIVMIIIIVVLILLFIFLKKRKGKEEEAPVAEAQPPPPEEVPPEAPPTPVSPSPEQPPPVSTEAVTQQQMHPVVSPPAPPQPVMQPKVVPQIIPTITKPPATDDELEE